MKVTVAKIYCLLAAYGALLSSFGGAHAATFYIDPVNGAATNIGSESSPWRTLQEVIEAGLVESHSWQRPYSAGSELEPRNTGAPVKAGDTLILLTGYHGQVNIHRYINDETIFIQAGPKQTPTLSQLHFQSSAKWSVSGVTISPIYGASQQSTLLRIESHGYNGPSAHITVDNNTIFSAPDISAWSINDWLTNVKSGISVDADHSIISNNLVRNIGFGITVSANHVSVVNNQVINFSGDALRGLGNYGLFAYNLVANAFKINGNHDDGFQSWSRDGQPVMGVTLRGNQFYTNFNHPNPSLLSTFQGIGCFDGFYNDWLIENNLVAVSHWHGISVYGANNTTIINNTVVDDSRHTADPMVPWIRLTTHKNGTFGSNNIVRNNIGRLASINDGVTIDFNLDPQVTPADHSNYDDYFIDRLDFNFGLKRSAPAVAAGTIDQAPQIDINGHARSPQVDVGAFQWRAPYLPFLPLLIDDD